VNYADFGSLVECGANGLKSFVRIIFFASYNEL
jgi:hypothetical protein